MDEAAALRSLPSAYAVAVVLSDAGWDHVRIGARLGIDTVAVPPLLAVARAKLAAFQRLPDEPGSDCL